jgi:hypothetical protein
MPTNRRVYLDIRVMSTPATLAAAVGCTAAGGRSLKGALTWLDFVSTENSYITA